MEDAITSALDKQRDQLELIVARTINNAVTTVNDSIRQLRQDLNSHMEKMQVVTKRVDKLEIETRKMSHQVVDNATNVGKLELKVAKMEDQDRRNNIRITGLAGGREGNNAISFLQKMLPKWIPQLSTRNIEIERAHRIPHHRARENVPPTMILRLLRHNDRNDILNGAREATKNGPILDEGRALRFYADYSAHTNQRRQAFYGVQKALRERGTPAFLIYPATLRVTVDGQQRSFTSPREVEELLGLGENTRPPRTSDSSLRDGEQMEHDDATSSTSTAR